MVELVPMIIKDGTLTIIREIVSERNRLDQRKVREPLYGSVKV